MAHKAVVLSVSDFVAFLNQTLEYAYPSVTIIGEIANFRVSKSKWVYFDLKDDNASVKFFGTVYQLQGPIEDGMMVQVRGMPRLHPLYGFSVTVQAMQPVGEGSIRRSAELLKKKLTAEGLFDISRKRPLPYPPASIGLITSLESAAYADFMKILKSRWYGTAILVADVQVQGDAAVEQIVSAIETLNNAHTPPEVIVITRGGGSADDLAVFSTERVTRAVAASRIPTLVAVGHEIDVSLAELAADRRASTPSNAAETIVPDRKGEKAQLDLLHTQIDRLVAQQVRTAHDDIVRSGQALHDNMKKIIRELKDEQMSNKRLLEAFNPRLPLTKGYAIVTKSDIVVQSKNQVAEGDALQIEVSDGKIGVYVDSQKGVK